MPSDDLVAFEHYRILRRDDGAIWELGRGAMGVTYKAIDDNLHKVVALKVINAFHVERESSRDRFLREARAAASLSHRNVAGVFHLGQNAQSFFYAMEFIDGETVEALVRRVGPLPWRDALGLVDQVARALAAAHDKRLVHRDIKPANLMLVPEAGEETALVKLIDFGLAKTLLEENGSIVAVSGSGFVGTPLFASPEQCNEDAPDIRSDLYSLGVTLWYMLTGQPPFTGPVGKVFAQHLGAPPPWDQLPADLPPSVRALLARLLAKDRTDRPQTPADLRRELGPCLRGDELISTVTPESAATPPPASARRGWLSGSVVAAVVLAAGLAVLLSLARKPASPPVATAMPTAPAAVPIPPPPAPTLTPGPAPTPAATEVTRKRSYVELAEKHRREMDQVDVRSPTPAPTPSIVPAGMSPATATKQGRFYLKQDPVKALEYFRYAAERNDTGGLIELGLMYEVGSGGLKPDATRAADLYQRADAQTNAQSQVGCETPAPTGPDTLPEPPPSTPEPGINPPAAPSRSFDGQASVGVIQARDGVPRAAKFHA